jgi:tRNA dimethylallyltransferase
MTEQAEMITILGHTAAGKSRIAALTAFMLGGEVISADSRQVYRGMTIGTGKDYADYIIDGVTVPFHLVDIIDAGNEYNVYEFQKDFLSVYEKMKNQSKLPVLCGGTGLYLESVLRQYDLLHVPVNESLRKELERKELSEIVKLLQTYKSLHNRTDTETKKRAVRAVEIAEYFHRSGERQPLINEIRTLTIGISYNRDERRDRITRRLKQRLNEGMISEAEALINSGVSHEKLEYYGLEYKFLSRHLRGKISFEEMFDQLNTAIHRFAKRQMTYFRGMEKRGIPIHWIDGETELEEKIKVITELYTFT